jgi:drug/metabolite transporter (DMT)-like permease
MPLFSLLILTSFRLERINLYQWSGTLIGFAGVVWFIAEKMEGTRLTLAGWGDLFTTGAAFSFAIYSILNKSLVTRYSSTKIMTYTLLFGAGFLIPICLTSTLKYDWSNVSLFGWMGLVYTAVFPTYIAYSIWNWAIARQGVARTSLFSYLTPPLSGILSAWLLNETFSLVKIAAFGVILGGLLLTRVKPRK